MKPSRVGNAPPAIGLGGTLVSIAHKDLRIELRTREVLSATSLFSVLLVVMASLAFYLDRGTAKQVAPGVLWLSLSFAGILATSRSWAREREQGVFRALQLSPCSRPGFYLGKALALLAFLLLLSGLLLPIVSVLFHVDWLAQLPMLLVLLFLGNAGFVSVSTLFGAMTVNTRSRDLVLSIVVFPLIAPALLSAVVGTRELFQGAPLSQVLGWAQLLLAFNLICWAGGAMLFGALAMESSE